MKNVFIVNPTAGRGSGQKNLEMVRLHAKNLGNSVVETTSKKGEAITISQAYAESGAQNIFAIGGDGTLSECLQGIIGSESNLGIIPSGTGNDFARTLGIPIDFATAMALSTDWKPNLIDLGMMNNAPFINVVACGFDAVVGERINKGYQWIKGNSAYIVAIVECLFQYQASKMKVVMDDQTWEGEAMICAVANAKSYGGGLKIAPDADILDGLFDVVIIEKISKIEFIKTLPKAYSGSHTSHPKVHTFQTKCVEVISENKLPVLLDGDLHGYTPFSAIIEPSKINFLMPK